MHSKTQSALFEDEFTPDFPGRRAFACPHPLRYVPACLPEASSQVYLQQMMHSLNWQQPSIHIGGRRVPIPRLQCWQGDQAHEYRYSGECFRAEPWHPDVLAIKRCIETISGIQFNSVLCNLYRDGQDSVSWHADDEPELGNSPWIASVSLGAERDFHIKLKPRYRDTFPEEGLLKLTLAHNSLLLMPPQLQKYCLHQLPKTKHCASPRINLTFRTIVSAP